MKNFLKENWFKILIILIVIAFLFLSRFRFIKVGGTTFGRCNKITGHCFLEKAINK